MSLAPELTLGIRKLWLKNGGCARKWFLAPRSQVKTTKSGTWHKLLIEKEIQVWTCSERPRPGQESFRAARATLAAGKLHHRNFSQSQLMAACPWRDKLMIRFAWRS
jgi:hypothetical protein